MIFRLCLLGKKSRWSAECVPDKLQGKISNVEGKCEKKEGDRDFGCSST